ncbi:MAG: hypothetical protein K1X90_04735 [Candidatus Kapabacteria bacterium]|nr:hypothetical protein [Candidatus Kapabacteria bacterium]
MPGSGYNNRNAARPNQQVKQRIPFGAKNRNWQKERAPQQHQPPRNEAKQAFANKPDAADHNHEKPVEQSASSNAPEQMNAAPTSEG